MYRPRRRAREGKVPSDKADSLGLLWLSLLLCRVGHTTVLSLAALADAFIRAVSGAERRTCTFQLNEVSS